MGHIIPGGGSPWGGDFVNLLANSEEGLPSPTATKENPGTDGTNLKIAASKLVL